MWQKARLTSCVCTVPWSAATEPLVLLDQVFLVVHLLSGNAVLPVQLLVARKVGLRLVQQAGVVCQRAAGLVEQRLVGARVDLRQIVATMHHLALVERDGTAGCR